MNIGIAGHMLLLEPREFENAYEVYDSSIDKRTKIYKNLKASAEESGKKLLSDTEVSMIEGACGSLSMHPHIGPLLESCDKELVAMWNHSKTGIDCKAKIDCIGDDFILDIKFTGQEIDPRNDYKLFSLIYERSYYRQLTFYNEGFEKKHLYIAFVETNPPFEVTWVDLMDDHKWCELGRREIDVACQRYIDFLAWKENGSPVEFSYPQEKRKVTCPDWALDRISRLEREVNEF